jgi:hypothetical protein
MTPELFDTATCYGRSMKSHAAARNDIGDVAELYACAALGMDRQRIDGRKKVCIDAMWGGRPVEIKSVGKNGRGLIYKWRMDKDAQEHGDSLVYVFVRHDCPITLTNSAEVVARFIERPPSLIVTSIARVREALKGVKLRKFSMFEGGKDSRIGYNRPGYSEGGWQFGLSLLTSETFARIGFTWAGVQLTANMHFTP